MEASTAFVITYLASSLNVPQYLPRLQLTDKPYLGSSFPNLIVPHNFFHLESWPGCLQATLYLLG
jgi:hypothetical protein